MTGNIFHYEGVQSRLYHESLCSIGYGPLSLEIHDAQRTRRPTRKSAQLKKQLLAELAAGQYSPGAALPSQERLAKRFGVSRPTVRLALTEMEQEGILRSEERKGTFVNENIQQQLRKTTGSLALVISGSSDSTALAHIRGFGHYCRKSHFNMLLFDSENDFYRQGEAILRLSQMDIDGVAMLPVSSPPTPAYHASSLQDRGIPLVFLHRAAEDVKAPLLAVSHKKQGRLVGRAFREHGHRRVAMLIGYKAEGLKESWMRGIRASLDKIGGELPDEFAYCCETTSVDPQEHEAELADVLKRMMSAQRPPTAIFAVVDDFAQAIYFSLEEMGLRVPDDVSLVGLGSADRNTPFTRKLTSVVIDDTDLSRRAVDLLCEMQGGERYIHDTEIIMVPISLYEGKTLGPAPKPKIEN